MSTIEFAQCLDVALPTTPISAGAGGIRGCGEGLSKLNAASHILEWTTANLGICPSGQTRVLTQRGEMQTGAPARRSFTLQTAPSRERLSGLLLLLDAIVDMSKKTPVTRRKNGRGKKRLSTRAPLPPVVDCVNPLAQRPTKRKRTGSAEGSVDHKGAARASRPPRLKFNVRIRGTGRAAISPQARYFSRKLPTLVPDARFGLSNDCFTQLTFALRIFYIIAKHRQTKHLFSLNDLTIGLKHRYRESNLDDDTINMIIQLSYRAHIATTKNIGHFKFEALIDIGNLRDVIKSALTIHNPANIIPVPHRRTFLKKHLRREWAEGAKVGGSLDCKFKRILSDLRNLK